MVFPALLSLPQGEPAAMGASTTSLVAAVATVIELGGYALFLRDMARGRARPSRASWIIWTPLVWLSFAGSRAGGAGPATAMLAATALGTTLIALASLRWGTGGARRSDLLCAAGTALGVATWLRTSDPGLGLACFIAADLCAALPTLRNVLVDPARESAGGWGVTAVATAVNLLVVPFEHWALTWQAFGAVAFIVYLLCINLLVTVLALRRRPPGAADLPALALPVGPTSPLP